MVAEPFAPTLVGETLKVVIVGAAVATTAPLVTVIVTLFVPGAGLEFEQLSVYVYEPVVSTPVSIFVPDDAFAPAQTPELSTGFLDAVHGVAPDVFVALQFNFTELPVVIVVALAVSDTAGEG